MTVPLRMTSGVAGMAGVGSVTSSTSLICQLRCCWTKASRASRTSAAVDPKNVGMGGRPATISSPTGLSAIWALTLVLPAAGSPFTIASRTKSAGTRSPARASPLHEPKA
jgi:hypothetical protein